MKIKFLLLFTLIFAVSLSAQKKDNRLAQGIHPANRLDVVEMPTMDNEALLNAEMARRAPGIAPRFAENIEVNINPETHGSWEVAENGNYVWRIRIKSATAKSLNFGFTQYQMPAGGSLVIYTPDYERILGPFTPADNETHEQLWTPVIAGDEHVIEVQLPSTSRNNLALQLSYVNHDFLGFGAAAISGSCNIDVICGALDNWPQVDNYRDIIRSVAVIGTGGGTFCTGFLINNARNDCTPYFMTANHCGINAGNAASLVAYWNYENSYCREVGSSDSGAAGDGTLNDFNTGSVFRAAYAPSDFTLVEFDDPVSETANAFFAGWSNEAVAHTSAIAVHHPSTDEKRISFEDDPGLLTTYGGNSEVTDYTHVRVVDWDDGTTEGGSSGSPLFDQNKRVIGQLHGGGAACGNDLSDWYGAMSISWEGGGSANSRLRDWLDPDNTGISTLDGREQLACSFFVESNPTSIEVCSPSNSTFDITISENFAGDVTLSLETTLDGQPGASVSLGSTTVAPGGTTTLTVDLPNTVATGQYNINITGTNGGDSASSSIQVTVFASAPAVPGLMEPVDNEMSASTIPQFSWADGGIGTSYQLQVASDADFNNILNDISNIAENNYSGITLETLTTYYWRVRSTNLCGQTEWSTVFTFTTADIACSMIESGALEVVISDGPANEYTSTLEITNGGSIVDIDVIDLDIAHTWVGDLLITLESPSGTVVTLMDRPGVPNSTYGCEEDNLLLNFDDQASNSADDLENSCTEGAAYALEGTFQPNDLLSAFNGENSTGTWTLSVTDNENQDGGTLLGWNLSICTITIPSFTLTPSTMTPTACESSAPSFQLTVGSAFEGDVTLSALSVPSGIGLSFSENPVAPGTTIDVTINGMLPVGASPIVIGATDGTNESEVGVDAVIEAFPASSALNVPANAATNVPLAQNMEWSAAADANIYHLEVATDAGFTNIIVDITQGTTSYMASGLTISTTYYWRVSSGNDCGTTMSEVFSFTTIGDLSIGADPINIEACIDDEISYNISVGEGYADGSTEISYNSNPAGLSFDFGATDPNNVTPGSTITATLDQIPAEDSYTITFTLDDGVNSSDVQVNLETAAPPAIPTQLTPSDNAIGVVVTPTLTWTDISTAGNYTVEIATDDIFDNVIESNSVTTNEYTVTTPLNENTIYYWRVEAGNDCGSSITQPFQFTTDMTDNVQELNSVEVEVRPNPTQGELHVIFSSVLSGNVQFELFAVNGQRLQSFTSNGQSQVTLHLNDYAAGIYLLRMVNDQNVLTQKVILQE